MKRVFSNVLAGEFVIDEQPEELFLSREEDQEDLTRLIARIMIENERLQDVNIQLEQRSSQPIEVEKFVRSLLPTLDSFDRVMHLARSHKQSEEVDNWLKSVETIYFRLLNLLESYGLFQMNCTGKKVDLNLHEVVEYRPTEEHPNETVIGERQKGYVFRNKLLRDAKVVVAYNERR